MTTLGCVLAALEPAAEAQDASRCDAIKDHDRREHCRAVAKGDVTRCGNIKDADLRAMCRATVKPCR